MEFNWIYKPVISNKTLSEEKIYWKCFALEMEIVWKFNENWVEENFIFRENQSKKIAVTIIAFEISLDYIYF